MCLCKQQQLTFENQSLLDFSFFSPNLFYREILAKLHKVAKITFNFDYVFILYRYCLFLESHYKSALYGIFFLKRPKASH